MQTILNDLILKGFAECGYTAWKRNVDNLHSRLRYTILNRDVPIEVIVEVGNLMMQLQEEQENMRSEVTEDQPESENESDDDSTIHSGINYYNRFHSYVVFLHDFSVYFRSVLKIFNSK